MLNVEYVFIDQISHVKSFKQRQSVANKVFPQSLLDLNGQLIIGNRGNKTVHNCILPMGPTFLAVAAHRYHFNVPQPMNNTLLQYLEHLYVGFRIW